MPALSEDKRQELTDKGVFEGTRAPVDTPLNERYSLAGSAIARAYSLRLLAEGKMERAEFASWARTPSCYISEYSPA